MSKGAVLITLENVANHEGHVDDVCNVHEQVDDFQLSTHFRELQAITQPRVNHDEE